MESQKISQLQRLKQVKTSYLLPEGFSQCVQSVSQTDRQRGKQGCGRYKPLFQHVRVCIYRSVFLSESQMVNQPLYRIVSRSVSQSVHRLSSETISQSSIWLGQDVRMIRPSPMHKNSWLVCLTVGHSERHEKGQMTVIPSQRERPWFTIHLVRQ